MVHIIGRHNVITHGNLKFWAERGLIHIEDARDNSYKTITVKQLLERTKAINDAIGNSSDDGEYADEIRMMQNRVDDYINLAREAREQGEPTEKDAVEDRKRRRATSVSMRGVKHKFKS